jgi:multidrug resistance efflux pump
MTRPPVTGGLVFLEESHKGMASFHPKLRTDLVKSRQETAEGPFLVIKDPVRGRYFRFQEIEGYIIEQLNNSHAPDVVSERVREKFGASLDKDTLDKFVEKLRQLDLLEGCDTASSSAPFQNKRIRGNLLYLRLNAFDPDRLLNWLLPRTRFFFTRTFVLGSVGMILLALYLTAANFTEIALEFSRLISIGSLIPIWMAILLVVWGHEFAHGLACKRYGGEVREMGFMLIYFFPAFYCNVSDTWLFPDKRKRMAVILAGAYFEIVVWALTTILWRITVVGSLPHHIALVVMASSGAKIFFNLNPLIKLDGYYLLSDFFEIPNLRAKAVFFVKSLMAGNFSIRRAVSRRERRIFLVYGVLAGGYSLFILTLIVSWAGGFLIDRYQGFGLIIFASLLGLGFRKPLKKFKNKILGPLSPREGSGMWKKIIKVAVPIALGLSLYFIHWDLMISSGFQVAPRSNADIRGEVDGIIEKVLVGEGDRVQKGQLLVLLSTRDYSTEIEKVKRLIDEKEARLRLLRSGPRPQEIRLIRQEVDTAQTGFLYKKREYEEGRHMQKSRLLKAKTSLSKAGTRVRFARKYFNLKEELFKDGLISQKEYLETQEALLLREKEQEEAQEEVRLVDSEKLVALRTALALADKRLKEAERKLDLLMAGSRQEELDAVKAELARLKVELSHFENQKKLTRIFSPSDGVVTTPKLDEKLGEWVKKGDLILEVYDFSSVVAEVAVPENEIADVDLGQSVVLKVRSHPGETFYGQVKSIAPVVKQESTGNFVIIKSRIDNPDFLLRPGMSGTAKINAGRRRVGKIFLRRLARTFRLEVWSWF